ncbi:MAG: nucleoside triphosphate pyrophosphatase [Planctomycetota bacterium]
MSLLLASTSPRRSALLGELATAQGWSFRVADPGVSDAAEDALVQALGRARPPVPPAQVVERLAVAKLLAGLRLAAPGETVLAADTTVALGAEMLGKAPDRAVARDMLWRLRGTTHEVHTGVAVADARGRLRRGVATSEVRFREFAAEVLERYLDSGAWVGKAGAYGVQDEDAAPLVEEVRGSRSNVIGLPLELVEELLRS